MAPLLFMLMWFSYAQKNQEDSLIIQEELVDTVTYQKTTAIYKERSFKENIQEKYSGKDFQYKENKVQKKKPSSSNGFLSFLAFFMSSVFPFLLGGFIIFILIRVALGLDFRFWNSTTKHQKKVEKLIYEDEDIHEINLEVLLKQAIENKEFRLAIRYYYLSTLKVLSTKQLIYYHKDKTNSEYLFEIENSAIRTQFSYLSYVYSYVWYGEFPVDETNFRIAENKYQSFLKSLV